MGRHGLDNGWIQFTQVRIPRENMLMRWGQVSTDGKFTPSKNQALSYMTLIGERLLALTAMYSQVGQSVTIAVRYGAVRIQGEQGQKILDYQSHQVQLIPVIAGVYCIATVSRKVLKGWEETQKLLKSENFLDLYQDYHATAAGLKAFLGWWSIEALESCRRW